MQVLNEVVYHNLPCFKSSTSRMIKIEFVMQSSDIKFPARFASTTKIAVLYSFVKRKLPDLSNDKEIELIHENVVLSPQLTCEQCKLPETAQIIIAQAEALGEICVTFSQKNFASTAESWEAAFQTDEFKKYWEDKERFYPFLKNILNDKARLRQLVINSSVATTPENLKVTVVPLVCSYDNDLWNAAINDSAETFIKCAGINPKHVSTRDIVQSVVLSKTSLQQLCVLLIRQIQTQHRFVAFLNDENSQKLFTEFFDGDYLLKQAVINPERVRLAIISLFYANGIVVSGVAGLESFLCWLDKEICIEYLQLPRVKALARANNTSPDILMNKQFKQVSPDVKIQDLVRNTLGGMLTNSDAFAAYLQSDSGLKQLFELFEGNFIARRLKDEPERLRGLILQYLGLKQRDHQLALDQLKQMGVGLPDNVLLEMLESNNWSVEAVLAQLGMV